MKREEALFIRSFKTKRADGHSIRTRYALTKTGVINIERTIVSTELNDGFKHLRTFGKYIYQCETMVFKFESFYTIAKSVVEHANLLRPENIIKSDEVIAKPNDKTITEIYIDNK